MTNYPAPCAPSWQEFELKVAIEIFFFGTQDDDMGTVEMDKRTSSMHRFTFCVVDGLPCLGLQ